MSPSAASGTNVAISLNQATPPSNGDSSKVPRFYPIAVGIGIGVPLAMLVMTLAFFLWKERKRRIIAERLGYAGQAFMKESYEREAEPVKPVFELAQEPPRAQLPGDEVRR
jgi:hypothetical protein